jgi:hypothetical protein
MKTAPKEKFQKSVVEALQEEKVLRDGKSGFYLTRFVLVPLYFIVIVVPVYLLIKVIMLVSPGSKKMAVSYAQYREPKTLADKLVIKLLAFLP